MKKVAIALVLSLLLVGIVAVPALAQADKVPLNAIGSDTGGGFVIFNNTSGPDNLQIEMSLKGAMPNVTYDVIVRVSGVDTPVGSVTTNKQGNANFHWSGSTAPGVGSTGFGLKREGSFQFGTGGVDYP
jgi:hypothetical protein